MFYWFEVFFHNLNGILFIAIFRLYSFLEIMKTHLQSHCLRDNLESPIYLNIHLFRLLVPPSNPVEPASNPGLCCCAHQCMVMIHSANHKYMVLRMSALLLCLFVCCPHVRSSPTNPSSTCSITTAAETTSPPLNCHSHECICVSGLAAVALTRTWW